MTSLYLTVLTEFFFSLQPIYKLILFWIIINCWRPVINLFILQDKRHLTALKHGRGIFSGTVSRRNFQCMGGTKLLRRHNSHLILCKPYFHKLPPAMKRFFYFRGGILGAGQNSQPLLFHCVAFCICRWCQPMCSKYFSPLLDNFQLLLWGINTLNQCEMGIHSLRKTKLFCAVNLILKTISAWNTWICTMEANFMIFQISTSKTFQHFAQTRAGCKGLWCWSV